MLTVQNVYDFINSFAPFDTQEKWDNSRILLGNPEGEVTGILVALDATSRVIDQAVAQGANLIVTHHPLIFDPLRHLVESVEDYENRMVCKMIRHNLSLIAAHTNWDAAKGGMNDALARLCGLTNVQGEGVFRVGDLPAPLTGKELAARVAETLHTVVRPIGPLDAHYTRVGLSTGGGCDFWGETYRLGANVFITGEIKHHHALAMADRGVLALECGHFATENPGVFALADALQKSLDGVQCKVHVSCSQADAYAAP